MHPQNAGFLFYVGFLLTIQFFFEARFFDFSKLSVNSEKVYPHFYFPEILWQSSCSIEET